MTTRVTCCQLPLHIGDTDGNRVTTRTAIEQAPIGGSVITDADGYPLAIAEFGKAGNITADIDLAESRIKKFNDHNDVHGDRRVDLYRRTALLG